MDARRNTLRRSLRRIFIGWQSRTHGSLYEQDVPLWAIHPAAPAEAYQYSKDIAAVLFELL